MKLLKDLFSERSDVSLMRVMSVASLIIGAYLAIRGQDVSVSVFVYAAFGGKAVQKFFETKPPSKEI